MSIYWAGGEDIDFGATVAIDTTSSHRRTSYSRCALVSSPDGTIAVGKTFPGGALTSCWFSFQTYWDTYGMGGGLRIAGLGKSGTLCGLWFCASATTTRARLTKYDGTTSTTLASESVSDSMGSTLLHKVDMCITDFGASGNVKVYIDGAGSPVIDYTGDLTLTGMTSLDCVKISGQIGYNAAQMSEFIVASEDTRTFSLVTLAPSAAGDTTDWTGAYTDIDEVTLSDADIIYTNVVDKNFQCNLVNTPSGNFAVKAAVVAARCARTSDSTPTKVKLGVKTNSTVDVDSGQSLTTAWETYYRIMETNPVTTSVWNTTELDALQLNLKSAS